MKHVPDTLKFLLSQDPNGYLMDTFTSKQVGNGTVEGGSSLFSYCLIHYTGNKRDHIIEIHVYDDTDTLVNSFSYRTLREGVKKWRELCMATAQAYAVYVCGQCGERKLTGIDG